VIFSNRRAILLSIFAALLSVRIGAAQIVYSTVALTGQPAPGAPSGSSFNGFIWPVINNAGKVAFTASIIGAGLDPTNDTGIWSNSAGPVAIVARAGTTAPGSSKAFDVLFGRSIVLDANGAVTFSAPLVPSDSGVWSGTPGALAVVALGGTHAPGTAGVANFSVFNSPVDSAGTLAFNADLTGADTVGSNHGIWVGTPNNLQLAARSGFAAPGTAAGTNFAQFFNTVMNGSAQLAFVADLTITSPSGTDRGLWRGPVGALSLVARRNTSAPGTAGTFSDFGVVSLNDAGHVLFDATYNSGSGLWSGAPGALTLVMLAGTQAPGMPAGTTFTSFLDHYISANDRVVFLGYDSTNNAGIWSGNVGAISLVAHVGNVAPGTNGALFSSLEPPEINANGRVAFRGGVAGDAHHGIWATNSSGALQLIALESNSLSLGPGDTRQISFLSLQSGGGNQDGVASSLNDAGTVAFHAFFADNSAGVFTASFPAPWPISSIQKVGSNIQIMFPSALNHTYQVEFKDDLTTLDWSPLGSPYNGTGSTITATDIGGGGLTKRFYHVLQL
jgi:hypothetical protein